MTTRTDFVTLDDLRYTASKLDGSHRNAITREFKHKPEKATFTELMGYFQAHGIKPHKAPKRKRNAG